MKRRSAFTLVEVMVSLGVMTIGAMAMIGMQQQTTRANTRARDISTAMQIAQIWIERLKFDGMSWRTVGNSQTDLADTAFLGVNTGSGTTNGTGNGATPTFATITFPTTFPSTAGVSNGFDNDGRDVPTDSPAAMLNVRFCASYRLTWVYRDVSTTPPSKDRAMRADVRVWWPKEIISTDSGAANSLAAKFPGCADDGVRLNPGVNGTEYENFHIVYLSTVIRPIPRRD